ncbi:hypothetical protein DPEC_G00297090 [Dallia pectoralis]|uniref:Uncharacterized protein n=1 Tax=Dallia pectoralis TaxID=75939 RepID=A0ACC2FFS3_DALPE|nr:hypothetical protein DPEC_G00297090 [Dallia pectoralis]
MSFFPAGYQPVYNPSIPYVGPIYGGLGSGMSVYIQGVVPPEASSFFLNLQCGEAEGSDIGVHFSPRFDDGCVVLNSCQGGEWGSEERTDSLPFSRDTAFEIVVSITQDNYQVKVNGQDHCTFSHHLPFERVNGLQIGGDVSVNIISILGGTVSSEDEAANLPAISGQAVFYPPVPYTLNIPDGLSPERTIVLRCLVLPEAYRFSLNFMTGSQDIAFHLNPRVEEGELVRNSLLDGNWGDEERDVSFNPFQRGQYVDFSIRCGSEGYKVFVNGKHLCDFAHRYSDLSQINTMIVDGHVQITYVSV